MISRSSPSERAGELRGLAQGWGLIHCHVTGSDLEACLFGVCSEALKFSAWRVGMQNDFLGSHKHCWSTSRPPQAFTICKPTRRRHNENIKESEDSVPQTSLGQGFAVITGSGPLPSPGGTCSVPSKPAVFLKGLAFLVRALLIS